jgi:hypothetical protein
MVLPGAYKVVAIRIQGWYRLRSQLKRPPLNPDVRVTGYEFFYSRLRQPAEGSEIIRVYFECLHN